MIGTPTQEPAFAAWFRAQGERRWRHAGTATTRWAARDLASRAVVLARIQFSDVLITEAGRDPNRDGRE